MTKMRAAVWALAGVTMIGAAFVARAEDEPSASRRPVEKELKAMAESVQKQAPDAAKVFADGIKEVAAADIVEKAPKVGDKVESFELPDASG